ESAHELVVFFRNQKIRSLSPAIGFSQQLAIRRVVTLRRAPERLKFQAKAGVDERPVKAIDGLVILRRQRHAKARDLGFERFAESASIFSRLAARHWSGGGRMRRANRWLRYSARVADVWKSALNRRCSSRLSR